MGFKRDENRGKKLGSRSGGWNPSHKLISREERANLRQDLETRAGSTLSKLQQKFSKIIAKDEQLKCIKEAVEVVFGFQGKPEQVELRACILRRCTARIVQVELRPFWMEPVETIVCDGVKLKYAPKLVPI